MPIYEYRCDECHQVFEEFSKHMENASVKHTCPICKGSARRLISHTSFALKGSGWYTTDYGALGKEREAAKKAAAGDSACEKAGDAAPCASACANAANCTHAAS